MGIETDLGWKDVTLFRGLLNVLNCFQHSAPAPWVHFLPLQLVTTSTSHSFPAAFSWLAGGDMFQCQAENPGASPAENR